MDTGKQLILGAAQAVDGEHGAPQPFRSCMTISSRHASSVISTRRPSIACASSRVKSEEVGKQSGLMDRLDRLTVLHAGMMLRR
jgi:hypothetical protein